MLGNFSYANVARGTRAMQMRFYMRGDVQHAARARACAGAIAIAHGCNPRANDVHDDAPGGDTVQLPMSPVG